MKVVDGKKPGQQRRVELSSTPMDSNMGGREYQERKSHKIEHMDGEVQEGGKAGDHR